MSLRIAGASGIQQLIVEALQGFPDYETAPADLVARALDGIAFDQKKLRRATKAIYAEAYYSCAKRNRISDRKQRQLDALAELLDIDDEQIAGIRYQVGLAVYKKRFRDAVADGELNESERHHLESTREFFGLRKRDIQQAITQQALAYYSFLLTDAICDGDLSHKEMAELALAAKEFGLTSRQLKSISVPNKKEILATALAAIKSRGEITPDDRDHIQTVAEYLNAKDLLKPCLMDLDLYERVFAIRAGELPEVDPGKLILDRGEKLHYAVPAVFEVALAGRTKRQSGTLYVGSRKMRFVGLRRSHEIRYQNVLQVEFSLQKHSKISLAVGSGAGGGAYRLKKQRDPGLLVEIQESIQFLIRKAKGLEVERGRDSRYIPSDVRSEVWYRDGGRCVICGATEYLEFDHIIPYSKGGATSVDNLQLLCRKCNSEKSDSI